MNEICMDGMRVNPNPEIGVKVDGQWTAQKVKYAVKYKLKWTGQSSSP